MIGLSILVLYFVIINIKTEESFQNKELENIPEIELAGKTLINALGNEVFDWNSLSADQQSKIKNGFGSIYNNSNDKISEHDAEEFIKYITQQVQESDQSLAELVKQNIDTTDKYIPINDFINILLSVLSSDKISINPGVSSNNPDNSNSDNNMNNSNSINTSQNATINTQNTQQDDNQNIDENTTRDIALQNNNNGMGSNRSSYNRENSNNTTAIDINNRTGNREAPNKEFVSNNNSIGDLLQDSTILESKNLVNETNAKVTDQINKGITKYSLEAESIKKNMLKAEKNVNKMIDQITTNDNKYYSNANNRTAKLLDANNGNAPMDPSSFSYKPQVEFDHKQPSKKIASSYGWSFMPPQFWSVPQKRPPACIPNKQDIATVTPIYDKSVPVDVLNYTQVGSILPKFEYKEFHNPNYYYPGWIAKDNEEYPVNKSNSSMKSGEYYGMNRATPTDSNLPTNDNSQLEGVEYETTENSSGTLQNTTKPIINTDHQS
tara:strand:- start:16631 stop:18112 length:1482 start_codon:yes stop_codon:yes gene_type:complete